MLQLAAKSKIAQMCRRTRGRRSKKKIEQNNEILVYTKHSLARSNFCICVCLAAQEKQIIHSSNYLYQLLSEKYPIGMKTYLMHMNVCVCGCYWIIQCARGGATIDKKVLFDATGMDISRFVCTNIVSECPNEHWKLNEINSSKFSKLLSHMNEWRQLTT